MRISKFVMRTWNLQELNVVTLHLEFHGTINIQINEAVAKVFWFITRQKNPFLLLNSPTLHYFTTGFSVPLDDARQIIGFLETGLKRYKVFRQESDNISQLGLPNFSAEKKPPAVKKSDSTIFQKVIRASQRLIDIARARDTSNQVILTYDLIETSTIFKEDLL